MTVWKSVRNAVSRWRAGRRTGRSPDDGHGNLHEAERLLCLAAAAVLGADALRRDGYGRAISGALAVTLAWRGITGRSRIYEWLGIDTARHQRAVGRGGAPPQPDRQSVSLDTSMLIDRPLEEVFALWRNVEAVGERMTHIESVEVLSPTRSRWIARGPLGFRAQWDAEIVEEIENERIAWRSLPGSDVVHVGTLTFERARQNRTIMHVHLKYAPRRGPVQAWVNKLFGQDPTEQIHEDLLRFKDEVEGRPPRGPMLH